MAVQEPIRPEVGALWERVLLAVQGRIGSQQAFDTWFRPIVPRTLNPDLVELEVPNPFFIDWLHEHHLTLLQHCCDETLHATPEVRLLCGESPLPGPAAAREAGAAAPGAAPATLEAPAEVTRSTRGWLDSALNPRLTFDSFVVGSANRFTHAACRAVADTPGRAYNPLFMFGGSGLGKTHLLHAVGHAVRAQRPDARITYVPAERFTNEMIFAIQHAQTLAFRNKYRSVDVLLIDDIQFLAGKEGTQEEFFYTFNALRDAHKQIVVTADKPPKDIPKLEERLISRFNQGIVTDLKQPDLETRIAILRNRCVSEGEGVRLPDDVLLLIADRIRTNIRDLEGCLVRLLAVASLTHQEMSLELAEEVLHHYVDAEPDRLTPERIVAIVAERFAVKPDALCGPRRTRTVVVPRQIAMYLIRQLTDLSLVEIGALFGGRDHSTVMYACEKTAERVSVDAELADKVNSLISTMASG
jgi:chromosomal replication initiator protein